MKKIIAPILAFVLVIAGLFFLNNFTAPVIAENASASLMGPLAEVLPGASGLTEMELADLPESVVGIYQENTGLGYSLKLSTDKGYTGNPIELALGVSSDGKITGLQITDYQDTKDVTDEFIASFNEKDSALAGVDLVSGATFSSSAIRNAVSEALEYMAANGMITAGVKSDSQIFTEMLPQVFPGMANASGILQLTDDSTEQLMKASNGTGAAAIIEGDGASYLQIVNINGDYKTFDAEGNEVNLALCDDLAALTFENTAGSDKSRIETLAGEGAVAEEIPLEGLFNSVTSAFVVTTPDATYYGFGTSPYAYANEVMPVFFLIDENGAIAKMTAPNFILHGEYFSSYTLDKDSYKEGFIGQTADTFSDDIALISGATMSSDAVATAANDVFEAFSLIGGVAQ